MPNTWLGAAPGSQEYYAAIKDQVFQGGAKYFTAPKPDGGVAYLTRTPQGTWQEVTQQEAQTGDITGSTQRMATLGPGSYDIKWLTQPTNLQTSTTHGSGNILMTPETQKATPTPVYASSLPPISSQVIQPTKQFQTDYTGSSIVDFLKSAGQASDFASRTKLAGQYGITNYIGTAQQNTQLLNLLKNLSQPFKQFFSINVF